MSFVFWNNNKFYLFIYRVKLYKQFGLFTTLFILVIKLFHLYSGSIIKK